MGESALRVVGYCRVSTVGQADEGVSLDAQTQRIHAWSALRGTSLDAADVFVDAGLSGKRADNRPALQAALSAVCDVPGAALVVYSLSRLARSTRDALAIAERLDRAGCDLVSLSEQLDTTSASGKMLFRLLAVLAEFERDLVAERTKSALHYKRTRGERIGQIPYGFTLGRNGRTLVKDDAETGTLNRIAHLASTGLSPRAIASQLQLLNVPTKKGRPWAHSTITRILKRIDLHEQPPDASTPDPQLTAS